MKKKVIISIVCFLLVTFVALYIYRVSKYVQAKNLCEQIKAGENISENAENHLTAPFIYAHILDGEFDLIKPEIPLEQACYYRNLQAVEVLLKNGANPNFFFDGHFSPLEAALVQGGETEEWVAIIKLLLEYGADINRYGSYPFIDFLCNRILCEDRPLVEEVLMYILEKKLNEITMDDCIIIMRDASSGGYTDIISYLLNHTDIDINVLVTKNGHTALIYTICSIFNQPETKLKMTKWLIEHGADVNIKDNNGKTAYDYAVDRGDEDLIVLLSSYMDSK